MGASGVRDGASGCSFTGARDVAASSGAQMMNSRASFFGVATFRSFT